MKIIGVALFGAMFCTVLSASQKVKEEHKVAFFGEDVHIPLPSLDSTEVLFKPASNPASENVLMRNGQVMNGRAQLNSLKHLVLEDVGEEDEGTYVIKNTKAPANVKHIILLVRDCAMEQVVKYGETYHIQIKNISVPISLEFRPSPAQVNQTTEPPAVLLLNQSSVLAEENKGRLSVSESRVTLSRVRGTDEGSYTVLDREGKVKMRTCLNVKEHQNFVHLSYGSTLKINMFVDQTKANLLYTPDSDRRDRVIIDQGELVMPLDPLLDRRLTVEGSMCILERVRVSDRGLFRVTDQFGFPVTNIYLEVEAYKLPTLYVAILSLLGLLVFLLLVCLFSCLINVHRRAEKARKIALIAQQAGKGDGEAFVKVVQEAYTRFAEESTLASTWDNSNATESTEVTIKGLEVTKAGRYHTLTSDKNFLEMSDSGVEFNSSTLPLDSECETDMPQTFTSHKLLLNNSNSVAATVIPEGADRTPDSAMSSSPVTPPRSEGDAQEEDLMGDTTPEIASRGMELAIAPEVVDSVAEPADTSNNIPT
ncbi:uncharacterized protein LOC105028595 [Esox lucius]|uniref:Uncharacterized protein n=1 Tax=Esox lucius TaxID=8010 RepID=A0A3P8YYL5_ESOLU|nr:uncharacterized protein LOC105028595 [Esox lucius]XP_034150778.1 uncharacterized protein LOC105028595 [Esox lucius]